MATQGIGKLWKPVVNVTNLDQGERFWSALTGLMPTARHGDHDVAERFSSLEDPDGGDDDPWLLLQVVPDSQKQWTGGTHLDLWVSDVEEAVRQAKGIGGVLIKRPSLYPSEHAPALKWAVMQDPFGNEFCFVKWPLEGHQNLNQG